MNERIKELEKQAYITEEKQVLSGGWDNDHEPYRYRTVVETKFSPEKFAELIVKECMDLCTTSYRTNDGWGVTGGDVRCHYAIAEHFDVETNTSYKK